MAHKSTYAVHYSKAATRPNMQYDLAAERFDPSHARLRPLCRTRGRKDVTADVKRVTCGACLTKLGVVQRFAIRHTWPNGGIVSDGFVHSGVQRPQPVAPYASQAGAEAAAEHMRQVNPGHSFIVVAYPEV